MVPVVLFPVFFCIISPGVLGDVPIHRNLTRKSSDLKQIKLPSDLHHLYMGHEKIVPSTTYKVDIETPPPSKCPNTDILLQILDLLTKSLPKTIVEPQKFKDVMSTIKVILTKAADHNNIKNLHDDVKILQDQIEKINKKDEGEKAALRSQNDKNLKAKLSLQYDVPDKCEHILYALVQFINNAYNQVSKYCLVTGNCKVDDVPQIKYDTDGQTKPSIIDILLQKTVYNPDVQDSGQTNPAYKSIYDAIKAIENYKPNSGPEAENLQNYLTRLNSQYRNTNPNNLIYNVPNKSQDNLLTLYPEWMLPESRAQQPSNPSSLQYIYSLMKNVSPGANSEQDYIKILTERLKADENPNKKQNNEDVNDAEIQKLLQSLGINKLPDKSQSPSKNYESSAKNQPIQTDQQAKSNINDVYHLLYSVRPDEIGNKLLDAYTGSYVTPDTVNITPDKTKQYVQLPDLSQLTVTNQDKLNTVNNQNEVVELTYMLKRPTLAYEPLYYIKYRVPYYTFLYNLQKLLIKSPYLRNQPKKLYQELLMHSNVSEASGALKNLGREELVKLIASNGTLVTAKIVTENKTQVNVDEVQNSTVNPSSNTNKTVDTLSVIEKLLKLSNDSGQETMQRTGNGLNSYYSYAYPSKAKSYYQSSLNYNPGNINLRSNSFSNVYGRPSLYGYNGASRNIYPSYIPSYQSMYASGYPQVG